MGLRIIREGIENPLTDELDCGNMQSSKTNEGAVLL
nr:MAG TPA: hypothetical protein [Caudoviricetes sp.]